MDHAATTTTRAMTAAEEAGVEAVLRTLREHFHEWHGMFDNEHDLVGFAIYEGLSGGGHCGAVLDKAAPFALAKRLVEREGFRWAMVRRDGAWRYAVRHPRMREPVELAEIAAGKWNRTREKERGDVASVVHRSYAPLVGAARG